MFCLNECAEKYERIFDAIMESYRITAMLPDGSYMDDDNIGSTYANETPKDSGYGNDYTDYMYWGGCYDGGWMDTELWFGLYSDGTQDPECGYITTTFRGMEDTGKLYYLGGNEFRWESEGYDSVLPVTYYVRAVYNDGSYQLDLYTSDGVYEVTFTLYEQYIP